MLDEITRLKARVEELENAAEENREAFLRLLNLYSDELKIALDRARNPIFFVEAGGLEWVG